MKPITASILIMLASLNSSWIFASTYFETRKAFCEQRDSKPCSSNPSIQSENQFSDLKKIDIHLACQKYYQDNNCEDVKKLASPEDKKLIMDCSSKNQCLDENDLKKLSCTVDGIKMEFEIPTLALNMGLTAGAVLTGAPGSAITLATLPLLVYGTSKEAKECNADTDHKIMLVKIHNLSLLEGESRLDIENKNKDVLKMQCDDLNKFLKTRLETIAMKRQESARWSHSKKSEDLPPASLALIESLRSNRCYSTYLMKEKVCKTLASFVMGSAIGATAGGLLSKSLKVNKTDTKNLRSDHLNDEQKKISNTKLSLEAHADLTGDANIIAHMKQPELVKILLKNEGEAKLTIDHWKSLGIKVEKGNLRFKSNEVVQNLDNKITEMVKSGKIKESETLRPVFLYDYEGKIIGVGPYDIPPKGAVRSSADLLSAQEFHELLSQGSFPIGRDLPVATKGYAKGEEPMFLHDINHFAGFLENPEYMAASREAAKKILATKNEITKIIMSKRYEFASEFSTVFDKNKSAQATKELENLKASLKLDASKFATQKDYAEALSKLNPEQLTKLFIDIKKSTYSTAQPTPVGGSEFMLQHRHPDRPGVRKDFDWYYDAFDTTHLSNFSTSEKNVDLVALTKNQSPEMIKLIIEKNIEIVANHLEKTDAYLRIKPQDWVNEAVAGKDLPSSGNVARLCRSQGINVVKDGFYDNFCRDFLK